jgi:hypothetical protein
LGCNETAWYPVIWASQSSRSVTIFSRPAASSAGENGCSPENSGQVIGSISAVALSFMVHEPSGIMLRSSATSLSDKARR